MYNPNLFIDVVNMLSLIVGMQNLTENRQQSEHNDVQTANAEQAKYILSELFNKFEEQNILLREILELLKNK